MVRDSCILLRAEEIEVLPQLLNSSPIDRSQRYLSKLGDLVRTDASIPHGQSSFQGFCPPLLIPKQSGILRLPLPSNILDLLSSFPKLLSIREIFLPIRFTTLLNLYTHQTRRKAFTLSHASTNRSGSFLSFAAIQIPGLNLTCRAVLILIPSARQTSRI